MIQRVGVLSVEKNKKNKGKRGKSPFIHFSGQRESRRVGVSPDPATPAHAGKEREGGVVANRRSANVHGSVPHPDRPSTGQRERESQTAKEGDRERRGMRLSPPRQHLLSHRRVWLGPTPQPPSEPLLCRRLTPPSPPHTSTATTTGAVESGVDNGQNQRRERGMA